MEVRAASSGDAVLVGAIYSRCARRMNEKGLYNWTSAYPTEKEAVQDQQRASLYGIYEADQLIGAVTLDQMPAPEYAGVTWKYPPGQSLCIHRIAVDPPFRRKGAASLLLQFAEQLARERGLKALRIDSFSKNRRAVRLYQNQGFAMRGEIFYPKKDPRVRDIPFYCFEKEIQDH